METNETHNNSQPVICRIWHLGKASMVFFLVTMKKEKRKEKCASWPKVSLLRKSSIAQGECWLSASQ